jgi:hypothetical protein
MAAPSLRLILQCVRNRVIDALELMSSLEEQRCLNTLEYAPYEVIARWGDSVDSPRPAGFVAPVFTTDELDAIELVDAAVTRAVSELPDGFPPLGEVEVQPYWQSLRDAAAAALTVFDRRGRLSEDVELDGAE